MNRPIAVLFAVAACHHGAPASPGDTEGGSDRIKYDLVTAQPAKPHWTDDIPARIVFDETRTSRIGAPLGGRVSAVRVELGDRVRAGAPLVTIISGDLAELRTTRDKARVDREAAQQNLDRIAALVAAGSLPGKELLAARQEFAEAEVALASAEQKLVSLRVASGGDTTFTLTAPRDGVIVDKHVAVGQQVSPDSGAVLAIADLAAVWLVADLLEDAVDHLHPGSAAEIRLDGADRPLAGTVEQVSAIVDPDRRTVPVRIKLVNPTGALRPGALAQVRFLDDDAAALAVPAEAVLSDGARSYVYVVTGGAARRRDVIAGPRSARVVAIRAGLAAGDRVVARGAVLLDNQLSLEDRASAPLRAPWSAP